LLSIFLFILSFYCVAAAAVEEEPATPEADESLLGSVFSSAQLRSGAALASSLLWSSWGAVVDASKDGLSALRQSELVDKVWFGRHSLCLAGKKCARNGFTLYFIQAYNTGVMSPPE
jgi:hypothetical protein